MLAEEDLLVQTRSSEALGEDSVSDVRHVDGDKTYNRGKSNSLDNV